MTHYYLNNAGHFAANSPAIANNHQTSQIDRQSDGEPIRHFASLRPSPNPVHPAAHASAIPRIIQVRAYNHPLAQSSPLSALTLLSDHRDAPEPPSTLLAAELPTEEPTGSPMANQVTTSRVIRVRAYTHPLADNTPRPNDPASTATPQPRQLTRRQLTRSDTPHPFPPPSEPDRSAEPAPVPRVIQVRGYRQQEPSPLTTPTRSHAMDPIIGMEIQFPKPQMADI